MRLRTRDSQESASKLVDGDPLFNTSKTKRRLGSFPVFAAIAMTVATSAYAADEAPAPALQEVVVTGSRIPQPNLSSPSQIQVLSDKDIKLNGTTDMVSLLNTLPQNSMNNVADVSGTSQVLSSAGGVSTADLRGLGPQRTMVLIDGKRLGTGDPNTGNTNPGPDLNQIPVQLVKRVDVVTGGASAVYGSDAIAGVVNFIMRRDFEGIEVDGQYGLDDHSNGNTFMQGLQQKAGFASPPGHVNDGYNRNLTVIMGVNGADGKSNATMYFSYLRQDPVTQATRDFSACKLNVNAASKASNIINVPSCNGSANSNLFEPQNGPNAGNDYSVVGSELQPYPVAGSSPPPLFNSNPYQYLLKDDTRYTAGFMAHYDFNDYAKVYSDFNFMNDQSVSHIGPSGAFAGGNPFDPDGNGGWIIHCGNPILSAQQAETLCGPGAAATDHADVVIGRRNIEGTGRTSSYEHTNYRAVLGARGDIVPDIWTYDVYGQYYYTTLLFQQSNYLSNTRIQNALDLPTSQAIRDAGGPLYAPCGGDLSGACQPYNIFTQGPVSPAALGYLLSSSLAYGYIKQEIMAGNVTGDLGKYGIKLPTAEDGIGVNFGFERRIEQLNFRPDETAGSGDLGGGSGAAPTINGGYSVNDFFGEARIPLVHGFPGVQDLVAELGYRHSDYSTSAGGVNSFKVNLQWAPIEDIRFRASFNRAIRAPNVLELFNPPSVTQTGLVATDPCAGASPTASFERCARSGVTAAQYGRISNCIAGQCSVLIGGNTDLKAETANTASVGFTVTPTFLPGFTGSVDYYQIKIKDEISTVPVNVVLALCQNLDNPAACALIHRGPNGQLYGSGINAGGYFINRNSNLAEARVSGVDFQLGYRKSLNDWGTLDASFNGSLLQKNETTVLPGFSYDCAGLYGATCQTVSPKWRHNARLSWQTPWKALFSIQWRFINSVSLDTNNSQKGLTVVNSVVNPVLGNPDLGKYDSFDNKLASRTYIDLAAFYDILPNVTLRAGVNNVLDKDPPLVNSLIAQTGSPNAYPSYDLLGRVIFVGFTAKF